MVNTLYDLLDNQKFNLYINKYNLSNETIEYIKKIITTPLTPQKLNNIFQIIAEKEWQKNKKNNEYYYYNNFQRTIEVLKAEKEFKDVIARLHYFKNIKEIIGEEKYTHFYYTLQELHYNIHNNINEENITNKKELVSLYLSLYTAINKEEFIKKIKEEYQKKYLNCFKINSESLTYKKIEEKQQRIKLLELYNKNQELEFIKEIKNKYSSYSKILNISETEFNILLNRIINSIIQMNTKKNIDIIDKNFQNYNIVNYLFKKIKIDIIKYAKEIKIDTVLIPKNIIYKVKFDDKNLVFNEEILKEIPISILDKNINIISNINKDSSKLFVDECLILFNLLNYNNNLPITNETIFDLLNNIVEIKKYTSNISIKNLLYLCEINNLIKNSFIPLSMLGYIVLEKTKNSNSYTIETFEKKVEILCDLASQMYKRNTSTIPYIKGNYENLSYSVYQNTNNDVLTCGIDTQTCLKAAGTENDFFHYTILSKNGINIKILDNNNQLVARVSGNRYGNGVYLNQLRLVPDTIVDEKTVLNAFRKMCDDIINQSAKEEKIEFIVITKSYLTKKIESNISEELANYIAINCIDNKSNDWQEFIRNKNLEESYYGTIINDYGTTDLICIKSIIGSLSIDKIKFYSAKDIYKRKRRIPVISYPTKEIEERINKIESIFCYHNKTKYNYIKPAQHQRVLIGDNWYIIFDKQYIKSCCLPNDDDAIIEYGIALTYVNEKNKIIRHR